MCLVDALLALHMGIVVFVVGLFLRRIAGQGSYGVSFIEHWLSRLLYWEAPWWVFVAGYTGFAAAVGVAWW